MSSRMMIARVSFFFTATAPLFLSGCLFGENKQFFENPSSEVSAITDSLSGDFDPTPTPSSTPNGAGPIAFSDGPFETAQNLAISIPVADLLLNDSDPNSIPLHYDSFQAPSSGSIVQSGNNLIFTPALNFLGIATFTYQIANSYNATASASVTINVRPAATQALYGQSSNRLYTYDPLTQTTNSIGYFKYEDGSSANVFDIAINHSGLMYGVNGRALYYINSLTSRLSLIPTNGIAQFGNINGLTALSDDRLVIAGNGVAIYKIATHELTTLVAPNNYQTSGDIIALPDGYLYWSVNSSGANKLLKIDPNSGAVTTVGILSYYGVWGLGYANHILYGFDSTGAVFEIDANNAHSTNQINTGVSWYGATTNPVLW